MNTAVLASLVLPTTVTIVIAPPPTGKVADKINVSEARATILRALNAWYYGA